MGLVLVEVAYALPFFANPLYFLPGSDNATGPGGGLTSAGATHRTPYGPASVDWTITAERLEVDVMVPAGCTATIDLPGEKPVDVGSGHHHLSGSRNPMRSVGPPAST